MTVRDGRLVQLSVSEVESFDPAQYGGCPRRWWFERAVDLRPEQTRAQAEGDAGHALLAHYFATGERPSGRPLMGKAVTAAIVKGDLPAPGPDLQVERRFDGQPKRDAAGNWIPLDTSRTLAIAGVPFDGFIDLAFRRGDAPEVWDHKFFTPARPELEPDPYAYCKRGSELLGTVQMPVYVLATARHWPDARRFRIVHHYVSKRGVDSLIRGAMVELDQVLERRDEIAKTIGTMAALAAATNQDDVPHARRGGAKNPCEAWLGCPHQSICRAYKGKSHVELTPEEAALFDSIPSFDEGETPAPVAAPPPAPPPAPAAPAAPRRHAFVDAPADDPAPAPVPTVQPNAERSPAPCACGAVITPENGSRLSSGEWKHIGCKLNATPPPPPPVANSTAAPAPADAPKRRGRPPKAATAETTAPTPSPVPSPTVTNGPTLSIPIAPVELEGPRAPEAPRTREALAALLENLAVLVRSAA